MKKNSTSFSNSGAYTSLDMPDYMDNKNVGGFQKEWYSERVPLPSNGNRRHISAAALVPFNSGRALPSKWDDAERWITSPLSGTGVCKALVSQPQRRPKSKSGPLGTMGVAYLPNYSPAVLMLEGGNTRNFIVGSPFTTGVLMPEGLSVHYTSSSGSQSIPARSENSMVQSSSAPVWSDLLSESSLPSSQDEKFDGTKDTDTTVSRVVSHRDMATQMSRVSSTGTSPKRRPSFPTSPPSVTPQVKPRIKKSAKVKIKDVEVDKGATVLRQLKIHGVRTTIKGPPDAPDVASAWDIAETTKNMSKIHREDAKITAWENLQKAKAEAAIQKLEMKLERKRSASMGRILNKLRVAQMKAQEMRRLRPESTAHQNPGTSQKVVSSRKQNRR